MTDRTNMTRNQPEGTSFAGAERFAAHYQIPKEPGRNTALILAGDFNSVPTSKSIGSLFNWAYSFKEAHTGTDDDCTLPDTPPTSAKFRNDTKYCLVSDYLFYCGKVRALAYLRRFDARDKSDYLLPTEDYGSDHLLTAAKFELY